MPMSQAESRFVTRDTSGATGGVIVAQATPPTATAEAFNVVTIQSTGADSNRINMTILGDGYTAGQLTTYASHAASMVDYLFNGGMISDPFGRYQKFFNIYRIDVISNQSGADNQNTGTVVDTALNARYYFDGVTERLLYIDDALANTAIAQAFAGTTHRSDMGFVSVNATLYGGGGGTYGVFAGGNGSARELALHEIGHAFADLADEYGGTGTYPYAEPPEVNVTRSATGAKWAEWIGYNQPGIGVIGAYEGGRYFDQGIYRPSLDSKMRSLGQPFDAISREQFVLKFYEIVDPLDSHSPNAGLRIDPGNLVADTIDPTIIKTTWSVNGVVVLTNTTVESFNTLAFNMISGDHTVSVRAYDDTDWVRGDRSSLEETVTWSIRLTNAIVNATNDNRNITGGAFNDELRGTDLADTLTGGAGNDTLIGNGGTDVLSGGLGNDIYINPLSSEVNELAGQGFDRVISNASFSLATLGSIERLELTGAVPGFLRGNNNVNTLIGNAGSNTISGFAGDDTILGLGGRDTIIGGLGRDTIAPGLERDTIKWDSVAESTGANRDVVSEFVFASGGPYESLDFHVVPTAVRQTITTGVLREANFDADLQAAVTGARLGAGQAVLFDPNGGDLNIAGHIYLIVDANGVAGYQAGQDYVVQFTSTYGALTLANFI